MKKIPVVIIGAGPAGLGAAQRLRELGCHDFMLIEKEDHVGGLAATFSTTEGFRFDLGGHVIFSHNERFRQIMFSALRQDLFCHQRNAFVFLDGSCVPYPIQDHYLSLSGELPLQITLELLRLNKSGRSDRLFAKWLPQTFGRTLSKIFFTPYNRKVWSYPLVHMGSYWMRDRINTPSIADILRRLLSRNSKEQWGPNAEFFYPKYGTGQLFEKIAAPLKKQISLQQIIRAIDHQQRLLLMSNGTVIKYKNLISSLNLKDLARLLTPAIPPLDRAAANLHCNSGTIIGLGLGFSLGSDKHWTYFPEKQFPYYRMTVLSNYSPALTPKGASSLLFEVSHSPWSHSRISAADIVATLPRLDFLPRIPKSAIVSVFEKRVPYLYPIPTLTRDRSLAAILPLLEKKSIVSIGRFGRWCYEEGNMDHSFLMGRAAADQVFRHG